MQNSIGVDIFAMGLGILTHNTHVGCAAKVCQCVIGKLERALGAANTPLLQPGVSRAPRPNSGGRPNSAGRPNSPRSAMAAVGRSSPSSRPTSPLKRPSSYKHVAMLADTDRAPSSSSAGESQPQEQDSAETQTRTGSEDLPAAEPAEPAPESHEILPEAVSAVELESAPTAVVPTSPKRLVSMKSVVSQTMRRQMSSAHGETLSSPRYHVGQGFAKWISRAVGISALKEKTEIQDLPAYRLRVSPLLPPYSHSMLSAVQARVVSQFCSCIFISTCYA